MKYSTEMIAEFAAGARAADGTQRAKSTAKALTVKMDFGDMMLEFDSADPNRKAAIADLEGAFEFFEVSSKLQTTYVFNKDGSVKTVEFPDDAGLDFPDPVKKALKSEYWTGKRKHQYEVLPDKAVSKGDSWTRDQEVRLGHFREMTFRIDFQYEGTVKKDGRELDRISGKITDVAYTGEDWREGPGLVKNAELKPAKSSVEVLFDRKLGRFVQTKLLLQVKGDLTLEAGDKELPAKVDITFESGMKVLPQEK